ncbi:MAG: prepilin-type N-terminal cleavage/methylation domain-containing protein, partial [Chloroflexota bacterium]|nr:prepilin-type N-terminal cleavage/methylation domain-containing protein [Chloroflexota bacterium]
MRQEGFSIIEFMIAIAIIAVVIGAAFQAHLTMSKSNITETAKIEGQFESAIELQILENDIKNAGFCVPTVCTVASKNDLSSLEAEDWEGFTSAETGGDYSNITGTDRLYLSDLAEIVEDFSSDQTESGALTDADYTTMVNAKLNNNGYFATLLSDVVASDTDIVINNGEQDMDGNDNGATSDYDFKGGKALIIAD